MGDKTDQAMEYPEEDDVATPDVLSDGDVNIGQDDTLDANRGSADELTNIDEDEFGKLEQPFAESARSMESSPRAARDGTSGRGKRESTRLQRTTGRRPLESPS
ncbi:hypothetical protein FQN49_001737 [Arthroderma sp. PD_2]|nr:hypothetical protein FQN49_001737 [Arthroderma sp. PD_2]